MRIRLKDEAARCMVTAVNLARILNVPFGAAVEVEFDISDHRFRCREGGCVEEYKPTETNQEP